jgi:hypothetical protein
LSCCITCGPVIHFDLLKLKKHADFEIRLQFSAHVRLPASLVLQ